MATFDPNVQTIEPNRKLADFSQGTSNASLQPLAEVPQLSTKVVEPDFKVNKSAGGLFEGLGEVDKAGLTLTDNIIKQNIDDTLNTGINKIRDSFGVAAATDIESGVASKIGQGGADGVSLAEAGTQQTPLVLQKLGNRVDGLTEMYKQGDLSNSAYYAKMNAYATQIKQQFPGYSDDIDTMVSSKIGTNPANALRSAIQDDVTKLQNKVQAQNDKWTTYEHSNAQYIYTQWPNYDQLKAAGQAPGKLDVEAAVGRLQARDYSYTAKTTALAADKAGNAAISEKGADIATQKANDIANTLVVAIPNQLGIKNPQDFTNLMNDVRNGKRPPLTPDEKQQLTGVYATMEQQYGISFDQFMSKPLSANTHETMASKIGDPAKIQAIRQLGMSQLTDLKTGLLDDKMGILSQTALWSKATNDAGEGDFLRKAPVAAYVAAGRKALGDQGIMTLIENQPHLQSAMLEGFRQFNQGATATGNKSITEVFSDYRREGINDANLNRVSIADDVNTVLHHEKMDDPTLGTKAVQKLFGEGNRTLLNAFNDKNQVDVFTQLVSPTMTKKIEKMDKTSRDTYTNWADEGFTTVYEAQAAQANQAAKGYSINGNLTLQYNPQTTNFEYAGNRTAPKGMVLAATRQLDGLNTAINTMKEVWKLEGRDPMTELYRQLPAAGIEPGTPIYKAIQDEVVKQEADKAEKK